MTVIEQPIRKLRGPRIMLDLPLDLANTLRQLAIRERRPLSRQIQVLVERALGIEVGPEPSEPAALAMQAQEQERVAA